ncbi:MAG: IS200/IS605 family element transposase accessory protein TnpB [Eggerthellaceae bacterium]|nr:IS200/IS605 family element transposase accessory protein TnpB [Eggerthellaceae bacterium]
MDKTFEYRIYPNASQQELLQKTFGCCRWVYNKVLSMRQEEYATGGKTKGINSYITLIPQWKRSEAPWLSEVDSMALQQSLRDLDKAYKNFFRSPGKVGFPRFKSKHASRKSYRTNNITIVDGKHIKLPKLGLVKARISRPIEGRILSATVKHVASGKYYVTVCCTDVPASQMPQGPVKVMGIDAGVHDLMVRSDGVKVANPKSLAKAERKLAREQRRLSRKQKGSANRAKQRRKLALVYEKVANRRKDVIHKATTSAVCESQAVAVEDLNVRGMQGNRRLAKAVSDASMGAVLRQLEYKCTWYGRGFVKVDRFYPSSKTRGCCGAVYDGLTLAMREWSCPECGCIHDRDLNAACNIAREGKRILEGTAGHAGTGAKAPTLVEQA